jgi:hypothetical protein
MASRYDRGGWEELLPAVCLHALNSWPNQPPNFYPLKLRYHLQPNSALDTVERSGDQELTKKDIEDFIRDWLVTETPDAVALAQARMEVNNFKSRPIEAGPGELEHSSYKDKALASRKCLYNSGYSSHRPSSNEYDYASRR